MAYCSRKFKEECKYNIKCLKSLEKKEKITEKDVGLLEDAIEFLKHAVADESHCLGNYLSTNDESDLKDLEEARKIRTFVADLVTENITVNNPVNEFEGALLEIRFTQDASGGFAYTLGAEFSEGTTVVISDLATTLSKTHRALWERRGSKWELLAISNDLS